MKLIVLIALAVIYTLILFSIGSGWSDNRD